MIEDCFLEQFLSILVEVNFIDYYILFRKLLASFLVFLFVIVAVPNFFIYALSKTYLNTDFYKNTSLAKGVYEFVLDKTTDTLQSQSDAFKGYFKKDELKKQIGQVFTQQIFSEVLNDFANQLEAYKKNPDKPMILSLKLLRQNLLTVSNNLVYIIYQDLPTCSNADLAAMKRESIPSCVPKGANYDQVVKPIMGEFESSIYNSVPEELGNIDKAVPLQLLVSIENYRNISFICLIVLIGLITLVLWKPISLIVAYVGSAMLFGGVTGLAMSYVLDNIFSYVTIQKGDPKILDLMHFLLKFIAEEMGRLAWLFVIVGVALLVIKFVLSRTVDSSNSNSNGTIPVA